MVLVGALVTEQNKHASKRLAAVTDTWVILITAINRSAAIVATAVRNQLTVNHSRFADYVLQRKQDCVLAISDPHGAALPYFIWGGRGRLSGAKHNHRKRRRGSDCR
jgi:hypothetical protein